MARFSLKRWFNTPAKVIAAGAAALVLCSVAVGAFVVMSPQNYDFSRHQKISQSSVMTLMFEEAMDHASVEQYLTLPEGLDVTKKWVGDSLVLQPTGKLLADSRYVIRVDAKALKKDGTILGEDIEFTFIVTGAPIITAQIPPPDSAHVPTDANITIVFDRPIVPLTQVQGSAADKRFAGWLVTVSPTTKGRWRWLGTTTASFIPEKPLTIATKYTVNVPAGIPTVSGDVTEKSFSWTFETERPSVVGTKPAHGSSDAGPGSDIVLFFNQEMDLISAKDSIVLLEKSGKNNVEDTRITIEKVAYGMTNEGDDERKMVVDKKKVRVYPASPLKFNTTYTVLVKSGIRGLVGDLGSAADYSSNFSTVGELKVDSAGYSNGNLYINFSNPVDGKALGQAITINPVPEHWSTFDFATFGEQLSEDSPVTSLSRLSLYPSLEPSTKYTVKIKDSLVDHYGQKLGKAYEFSFTTPQLPSRVFLHPEGKAFGIFEKGKPPVYFANDVNVSVLNVEFGKLSFEKFLEMRRRIQSGNVSSPFEAKEFVDDYKRLDMKPKAKVNAWESQPLDIEKTFGTLKPGLYFLAVRAPEWFNEYNRDPYQDDRIFALTNMAMTLKYSGNKALVWVTDLQTGEAVPGAVIQFRTINNTVEISGKTDKSGFFETKIDLKKFQFREYDWQPEFWVTAEKNDDFAFIASDWNSGVQPYDFDNVYSDFRGPQSSKYRTQSALYTERPLYGAGDTVHFKGIVRMLGNDGTLSLPSQSRSAQVRVTDTNGIEIFAKDVKLSEFGTFNGSFPLAKEAPLGMYSIVATLIPDSDVEGAMYSNFSVLAYRKPEYKVTVVPQSEEYANKDSAAVDVTGAYYFGAPMGGAKVDWRLVSSDYYFNKYTDGWYSFALEDSWCWWNCSWSSTVVSSGTSELDASGRLNLPFSLNIDEKSVSQVATLEADITDRNNQVVSSRGSFVIHKADVYVGIRSDEYGVAENDSADMKIVTVNPDGTPLPKTAVTVSLYARKWNVTKQKGVDGEYYYESEPEDTFIRSQNVVTNEEGKATVPVTLSQAGEFRVIASTKDSKGREAKAGWSVYAWGDIYFNWPRTNNDRIDIVADKPEYKVGDTAKLIVKSPYQGKGVKALVTVERENVISKRVVDVTSNALPIEVEIEESMIPTVYVSAVIIKPRIGETFNENGLDTGAPAFKVGYAKLAVDTSLKKLDIAIVTDKEKYSPGEKVNVNITVKDAKGKPAVAELSLGVVDMSLLDLTGFEMPDLVSTFYWQRGLGVMTSNMLTFLMERFKPGSKGGGGDGDGEEKTRGTFKDTAYWNPRIVTDANGTASVSFSLPDNLTTWQILALGATKDTNVGGFAKNIIETKKVILRPVRPRFGVVGDHATLGAIVHNYLDVDTEFKVTLKGEGFVVQGKSEQKVTVPKDSQVKVLFPVKVSDSQRMTMNFSALTDGAKDDIIESIPVHPFGVDQTNATGNVTEDQETEKISVPTKADAPTGSMTVTASPTLAVYLPESLEYLSQYPYGCAEQTVSSFVPNIALAQLKQFDQFKVVEAPDLEKNVLTGLQKLYTFQRSNGGFGYFETSYESYPYLTAYILHALKLTKDAGYSVDANVTDRAMSYLKSAMKDSRSQQRMSAETKAYALFVMSEYGTNDVPSLNVLYKGRNDMPLYSRAYLAMAYKKTGKNDSRAVEILHEILGHAKINPRGAHFEEMDNRSSYTMNTDARTTAIVLQAIVRIEPDHELLPRVIRGMLANRTGGHWDTTQSTAMSVLSFVEYLKQSNELEYNEKVGVQIAGKQKMDATFKAPAMERKSVVVALAELPRGKEIDVKVGKTGPGKLYYDVILSYFYAPDVLQPAEEGIGILRETKPLTKADASRKVGTTQKVTLTITVPDSRNFVAVESMLPAGYEPIDLQFATSQQNLLGDETNTVKSWRDYERNQLWRFSHIEFRDDRVFMFAEQLPAGVYTYEYLVRLTTPGKFRERPARVYEMYFPEVFGQTEGSWITINE